jgi:hypothetical protein
MLGPAKDSNQQSADWGGTAALLLAFGVLYTALSQDAYYRNDAGRFVAMVIGDSYEHPHHALYPQLLRLTKFLTAWLGLTPFAVAALTSSAGAALGVAMLHRAARYAVDRGRARWVAALCGALPAVSFFATVVEVHGPFLAPAAAAWWMAGRWERSAALRWALASGAATGVAAAFHGTGQLLPAALLAWVWTGAAAGSGFGRWLGQGCALLAVHAVAGQGLMAAVHAIQPAPPETSQLGRLLELAAAADRWELVPATLGLEWLLPFAPFSVTWLAALRRGAETRRAVGLLAVLALYVGVTFLLLEVPRERGAYLLPLSFPAVLLTVRHLRPRAWLASGALAAAIALGQIAIHGRDPEGVALVADMRAAIAASQPFVFLGPREELNGVMRDWPELPFQPVHELLIHAVPESAAPAYFQHFDQLLASQWARGRTVYLTEGARRGLCAVQGSVHERLYREHLAVRYRLVPVARGQFRAERIEPPR